MNINTLKAQGYTDEEIAEAMQDHSLDTSYMTEDDLQESYNRTMTQQNTDAISHSIISGQANQENLIKWQLELDSQLERIEHILRGDKPKFVNGNTIFVEATETEDKLLNDRGVNEIMRILTNYVNRNTILSNYDEDTINAKMLDLGNEVSDLIFMKYEHLGLNTLEKRKRYPMIVREVVDVVHSSYLRALHGGERDSLREARTISQSEALNPMGGMPMNNIPLRERSILNPLRWIRGKYAIS